MGIGATDARQSAMWNYGVSQEELVKESARSPKKNNEEIDLPELEKGSHNSTSYNPPQSSKPKSSFSFPNPLNLFKKEKIEVGLPTLVESTSSIPTTPLSARVEVISTSSNNNNNASSESTSDIVLSKAHVTAKKVTNVTAVWTQMSILIPLAIAMGLIMLAGLIYLSLHDAEKATNHAIHGIDDAAEAVVGGVNELTQTVPQDTRQLLLNVKGNLTDNVNLSLQSTYNLTESVANSVLEIPKNAVNSLVDGMNGYQQLIANLWDNILSIKDYVNDYCGSLFDCPNWPSYRVPTQPIDHVNWNSIDLTAPSLTLDATISEFNLSSLELFYQDNLWNVSEPAVKDFYNTLRKAPYYLWAGGVFILSITSIIGILETLDEVAPCQNRSKMINLLKRFTMSTEAALKKLFTNPAVMGLLTMGILLVVAGQLYKYQIEQGQQEMEQSVKPIDQALAAWIDSISNCLNSMCTSVNEFIVQQSNNLEDAAKEAWEGGIQQLSTDLQTALKVPVNSINQVIGEARQNQFPAPFIPPVSVRLPSGSFINVPAISGLPENLFDLNNQTLSIQKNILPLINSVLNEAKSLSGGMTTAGAWMIGIPTLQLVITFMQRCLK